MAAGRGTRVALFALGVLLLALFSFVNRGERVSLSFGVGVLYRIPLVALLLGTFILGMVTMFVFSLRHDRKVRRLLREQGLLERPAAPWVPEPPPTDLP